jgi:hypothetical protein
MIFISHAWSYSDDYWTLVSWFNDEPNFSWKNCSVPSHDGLPDKTASGLSAGIRKQISPAQCVVILGGMYAAHSNWIDYEINEAVRMGKPIVAAIPWAQQRVPTKIRENATREVRWTRASVIGAIRELT